MFEGRLRTVALLGVLFFVVIGAKLFDMQVLQASHWREKAKQLGLRRVRLTARRGSILDRHGAVLATDRREWDLVVRLDHYDGSSWRCRPCGRPAISAKETAPTRCRECRGREFDPGPERDDRTLPALFGITPEEFRARIERVREDWRKHVDREKKRQRERGVRIRDEKIEEQYLGWNWIVVKDVESAIVKQVSLHPERHRGLSVRSVYRRANHAGPATKRIVGVTSGVYKEEWEELKGKGLSLSQVLRMQFGRSGMERIFESRLASHEGYRIVDRDARGRVQEILEEDPARDGETIRTSLDLGLQEFMTRELREAARKNGARGAFFVAMEPESGEVLVFAGYRAPGTKGVNLEVAPVVPGSVFKVVTAIAALETGTFEPTTGFECTNMWHRIGCHGTRHGPLNVAEALTVSCNGYYAWAGGEVGIDALADWARRLGFGAKTGLEITGEAKGLIPDPAWKAARFDRDEKFREMVKDAEWQRGETWQVGFGQGALSVTPLQIARLMATVANGGRFVRPTFLLGGKKPGERLLSDRTLAVLREGLSGAVTRGTAAKTDLHLYRAAGKTGTGQLPRSPRYAAWFAGYAPVEAPRIAFACCVLDVEGGGGDVAGPVCATFLKEYSK